MSCITLRFHQGTGSCCIRCALVCRRRACSGSRAVRWGLNCRCSPWSVECYRSGTMVRKWRWLFTSHTPTIQISRIRFSLFSTQTPSWAFSRRSTSSWAEEGKATAAILVGLPFGNTPSAIWKNRSYYLLPRAVGVIDYYDAQIPLNNGGGAPELARFLQQELLPYLLKQYSVKSDRIGLAGFSLGGLFAAWHVVTHPGTFSDYIVIAPPLAAPFVGLEFDKATQSLRNRGFTRATRNLRVVCGERPGLRSLRRATVGGGMGDAR